MFFSKVLCVTNLRNIARFNQDYSMDLKFDNLRVKSKEKLTKRIAFDLRVNNNYLKRYVI